MKKNFWFSLLVLAILTVIVSSGFAVIKKIEKDIQSMVKVGEGITIPEGGVVTSAVSVGGAVTVYGKVLEDVVSVGDSIYLKDSAEVAGNVVAVGGKVMKEPGAIIKGNITEVAMPGVSPAVMFMTKQGPLFSGVFEVLSVLGLILLAWIAVAMFMPQLGAVSGFVEKNLWKSFLIGLLILIIFVPIIFLLLVSIMGIALIPVWVILVFAAGLFGHFAVGHVIGKKALNSIRIRGESMMTETLFGVILIALVGLIPVVGWLVKALICLCGLGGVYVTRFGTQKS